MSIVITPIHFTRMILSETGIMDSLAPANSITDKLQKAAMDKNYSKEDCHDEIEAMLTITALEMIKSEIFYPDNEVGED